MAKKRGRASLTPVRSSDESATKGDLVPIVLALERMDRKLDALGSRWGVHAESAFREAMRDILWRRGQARERLPCRMPATSPNTSQKAPAAIRMSKPTSARVMKAAYSRWQTSSTKPRQRAKQFREPRLLCPAEPFPARTSRGVRQIPRALCRES